MAGQLGRVNFNTIKNFRGSGVSALEMSNGRTRVRLLPIGGRIYNLSHQTSTAAEPKELLRTDPNTLPYIAGIYDLGVKDGRQAVGWDINPNPGGNVVWVAPQGRMGGLPPYLDLNLGVWNLNQVSDNGAIMVSRVCRETGLMIERRVTMNPFALSNGQVLRVRDTVINATDRMEGRSKSYRGELLQGFAAWDITQIDTPLAGEILNLTKKPQPYTDFPPAPERMIEAAGVEFFRVAVNLDGQMVQGQMHKSGFGYAHSDGGRLVPSMWFNSPGSDIALGLGARTNNRRVPTGHNPRELFACYQGNGKGYIEAEFIGRSRWLLPRDESTITVGWFLQQRQAA
jgi:hypothetical protein